MKNKIKSVIVFLLLTPLFASCQQDEVLQLASSPKKSLHTLFHSGKKQLNIAFIGGSITEGAGASDYQKAYLVETARKLSKELNIPVEGLNFGIGASNSIYGLYRLSAIIASKPDLVVVEFAVNDASFGTDSNTVFYNHENIFRQLYASNIPVVSLNLNTEKGSTAYPFIKKVAARQDVLNVRVNLEVGEFVDGTHPNDAGHQKIAHALVERLMELKNTTFSSTGYILPSALVRYDFDNAMVTKPIMENYNWTKSNTTFYRTVYPYYTQKANDTLDFTFFGNRIGIVGRWRTDEIIANSSISFSVDGLPAKTYDFGNNPYQSVVSEIIAENLVNGEHSLKVIVSPIDNSKSSHHEILDFMLSGYGSVWIR